MITIIVWRNLTCLLPAAWETGVTIQQGNPGDGGMCTSVIKIGSATMQEADDALAVCRAHALSIAYAYRFASVQHKVVNYV